MALILAEVTQKSGKSHQGRGKARRLHEVYKVAWLVVLFHYRRQSREVVVFYTNVSRWWQFTVKDADSCFHPPFVFCPEEVGRCLLPFC